MRGGVQCLDVNVSNPGQNSHLENHELYEANIKDDRFILTRFYRITSTD